MSCRRPDGTSQEDNGFVVGGIAVPAGSSLDVFYSGVVGFDFPCCGSGDDEYLNPLPPSADGAVKPVGLRPSGRRDQFLENLFGCRGVFQGTGVDQGPELLLDLPAGPEGAGGIIEREYTLEPGDCPAAEPVSTAKQQHAVRPSLIDGPDASALDLLGEVLPGLGHGLVGQRDQVEMIDRDSGAGTPHPHRFAERRRGVDRDDLHRQPPFQRPGEQPATPL